MGEPIIGIAQFHVRHHDQFLGRHARRLVGRPLPGQIERRAERRQRLGQLPVHRYACPRCWRLRIRYSRASGRAGSMAAAVSHASTPRCSAPRPPDGGLSGAPARRAGSRPRPVIPGPRGRRATGGEVVRQLDRELELMAGLGIPTDLPVDFGQLRWARARSRSGGACLGAPGDLRRGRQPPCRAGSAPDRAWPASPSACPVRRRPAPAGPSAPGPAARRPPAHWPAPLLGRRGTRPSARSSLDALVSRSRRCNARPPQQEDEQPSPRSRRRRPPPAGAAPTSSRAPRTSRRPRPDRLAGQEPPQVVGQRLRRGVSPRRVLLQALQADRLQVARQPRLEPRRRHRLDRP